jgi:hypothetical protein
MHHTIAAQERRAATVVEEGHHSEYCNKRRGTANHSSVANSDEQMNTTFSKGTLVNQSNQMVKEFNPITPTGHEDAI